MRVAYRRQHPSHSRGCVPDFLMNELAAGEWERTGFEIDFPAMFVNSDVTTAMGFKGKNFAGDSIDIIRWYNRETRTTTGSVVFAEECEGPPGFVHGGAVASALDDILGTMVWRFVGFSRVGIPTMQLTVKYRGPVPLRRQLRHDAKVVKLEGRKVFVKASLREPYSGKLLAEADGLFYVKNLVAPPLELYDSVEADTARPPETLPDVISYDEAIRQFGGNNPNASANLVAFYTADAAAAPQAKL